MPARSRPGLRPSPSGKGIHTEPVDRRAFREDRRGLVLIETRNWGKTVAFWKALGYELELETDHHSGQLLHPAGGPYLFVAERPPEQVLQVVLGVGAASAEPFTPPASGTVAQPFEKTPGGTQQMLLTPPDGRTLGVEAPLVGAQHE